MSNRKNMDSLAMTDTLITLARFHYWLGYISHDEYLERVDMARWLQDEEDSSPDPRQGGTDEQTVEADKPERDESPSGVSVSRTGSSESKDQGVPPVLELTCLGVWVFTKSDRDSYPSVPHGHHRSQNAKWPKLNPYSGRVFFAKHQEDKSMRLSKAEMKKIWRDESFRSFCREMIVWYQEQCPYFTFPVTNPLKLPGW